MTNMDTAKLDKVDGHQVLVLPDNFQLAGDTVRISRVGGGIYIQPVFSSAAEWFAAMDSHDADEEPIPGGRDQPPMQERDFSGVFD